MVKALLVVLALTAPALAEEAHNKLGFQVGFGRLHAVNRDMDTVSLGLTLEHPVFSSARVFAEYEWMWFGDDQEGAPAAAGLPGSGHRTHVGLRTEILGTTVRQMVHFYVDAELGGGLGVLSDDISGVQVIPHGFVGVRAGYDFIFGDRNRHSSRLWEAEVTARAIRFAGGTGALVAIGMMWGD